MRIQDILLVGGLLCVPHLALAQDSDGDGSPDASDAFPCNPTAAAERYLPAQGQFGSLQFEDFWPSFVDNDYQDNIVAYNHSLRETSSGAVTQIRTVLSVLASGGVIDHGIGIHYPVPAAAVSGMSLSINGAPGVSIVSQPGDAELTVRLVNDIAVDLFGPLSPVLPGQLATVELTVDFVGPVAVPSSATSFDIYTFRTTQSGHEIHTQQYCGTANMQQNLFGSGVDSSNVSASRCYTDQFGLPSALEIPTVVAHGRDQVDIALLYPRIITWAASGGTTDKDWYTNPDAAHAAGPVVMPIMPSNSAPVDRSCLPSGTGPTDAGTSCLAILNAGASVGDGGYWLDPNGGSTADAFLAQCDMSQDGGGWTKLGAGQWWHGTNDALSTNSMLSPAHITDTLAVSSGLFRIGTAGPKMYLQDSGALVQQGYHYWRSISGPVSCSLTYDPAFPANMTAIANPRQVNCDPYGIGSHACGYGNGWILWHVSDTYNHSGAHPCAYGGGGYPTGSALQDLWVR